MDSCAYIYMLWNMANHKFYIGSTCNPKHRKHSHLSHLKLNKHGSSHLQAAFNRYGENAFSFEVIDECSLEDRNERETAYIKLLGATNNEVGYNVRQIADSGIGVACSEEKKKRIGLSNTGKVLSQSCKEKISYALKGRKHSPEWSARIGLALRGRKKKPLSQEQKDAISRFQKGRKHTALHNARVSAALKGKPNHWEGKHLSEDHKNKIRMAHLGKLRKPFSEETKQRMSDAHKGKKLTEQHKLAMWLGRARYFENRRLSA